MSNQYEVRKKEIEKKLRQINEIFKNESEKSDLKIKIKELKKEVLSTLDSSEFIKFIDEDEIELLYGGIKVSYAQYKYVVKRLMEKYIRSEINQNEDHLFVDKLIKYMSKGNLIDEWARQWDKKNEQRKKLVDDGLHPEMIKRIEKEMVELRNRIWVELNKKITDDFSKKKNSYLSLDEIRDIVTDIIVNSALNKDSKSAYTVEKSDSVKKSNSFYGYFIKLFNWRIKGSKNKKSYEEISFDIPLGEDSNESLRDFIEDESVNIEQEIITKDHFEQFPRIITELTKALGNHKKKDVFYTIFTFNTVDETEKEKRLPSKIITGLYIRNNSLVFPMMVLGVVVYLKDGRIADYIDMFSVIEKALKENINLKQRQILLSKYMGISRQTFSSYDNTYKEIQQLFYKKDLI